MRFFRPWLILFVLLLALGRTEAYDGFGIAPVITLPTDDGSLSPGGTVPAQVGVDPAGQFNLGALAPDIHAWVDSSGLGWYSLEYLGSSSTQWCGIVVIGVPDPWLGRWQYGLPTPWTHARSGTQFTWVDVVPGDHLPLRSQEGDDLWLRFVPEAHTGDTTVQLDFRAWDDGTPDDSWIYGGGSPGPYSAEARTINVQVAHLNDAPEVYTDITSVAFPDPAQATAGDNVRPATVTVQDLIAGAGDDPDFDALGIAITAVDFADGTWEWAQGDGAFTALPAIGEAFLLAHDDRLRFTPDATAANGTIGVLTIRLWDGTVGGSGGNETLADLVAGDSLSADSLSVELDIDPFVNTAPVIDALDESPEVADGDSVIFTVAAADAEGDPIMWTVYNDGDVIHDPSAGTLTIDDNGDGTADITYQNTSAASTDIFTLAAEDVFGAVSTLEVTVTITAPAVNNRPYIANGDFPDVAVVGRPWEWLVTVRDDEADTPLTLSAIEFGEASLPAGFTLTAVTATHSYLDWREVMVSERTYRLRGTPSAAGSITLRLTPSDAGGPNPSDYVLTSSDPGTVMVDGPVVPLSTAEDVRYAAVAPGSDTGFASLLAALGPHGPDIARGWWWRTATAGFLDVESTAVPLADRPTTAAFLASTVPLDYTFDATPYPMPFAITLPPSGWVFFGVPPLFDGESSTTSHDWSDFVLQDANGLLVDEEAVIQAVFGADVDPPWSYDPTQPVDDRYQPATTLASGHGYWLRNRSAQTYRLVRVASDDGSYRIVDAAFAVAAVAAARSATVRSASERPPAPPAGGVAGTTASAPAVAASGGSACGAGGLAGLLLIGSLLLGLRRRS